MKRLRVLHRWLTEQLRRVCWRRSRRSLRLLEHRLTWVCVYGDARFVCIDCSYIEPLGKVRPFGTNKLYPHDTTHGE